MYVSDANGFFSELSSSETRLKFAFAKNGNFFNVAEFKVENGLACRCTLATSAESQEAGFSLTKMDSFRQ
jgi:hypothetical protein